MDLFAPDIFSRPRPLFEGVMPAIRDDITAILARHYGIDPDTVGAAEGLIGLEVNSKNYKVTIDGRDYALKRAGAKAQPEDCRRQLLLTQELRRRGVAVPDILDSTAAAPFAVAEDQRLWILSAFINGSYFEGTADHYASSIAAIASLQGSLESLPSANDLPVSIAAHSWAGTAAILDEFFARRAEWPDLFPADEYALLHEQCDHIHSCARDAASYGLSGEKPLTPVHIDLHSHNILMQDNRKPVIVDIDSLQRADKVQSLAFAIFKLTRQHIVKAQPADRAAPARQFLAALNVPPADYPLYRMAATAEVLRRVGIILTLNMQQSNREWNTVLPLQLRALHEMPHVFAV